MTYDPFPREFVPKVIPGASTDRKLFGYNDEVPAVQVKFHRSTWFVNQERDDFISPQQTLLLSSMEGNERLMGRTPQDEFNRLEELDGIVDVYFPGDRWIIDCDEMNRREILKEIRRSVEGQKALKRMVDDADLDVALYPVIVGWKPWHYENCRELFDVFETKSCAFDGTEYDSKFLLWNDLENLVNTLDPERIYLNGRVSREQLYKVPEEVVAFSGKSSILERIRLPNGDHSCALLSEEVERRVNALYSTQTKLSEFMVMS